MDREDGLDPINKYEGKRPPSLDLFSDFVGLTEEEFFEIAKSHIISPHVHNQELITQGEKMHDFNLWSKDGKMQRGDALKQLENWRNRKIIV